MKNISENMRGEVCNFQWEAACTRKKHRFCYSWNPEEAPRWQHLSSTESSTVECLKVILQELEEHVKRERCNIKQ